MKHNRGKAFIFCLIISRLSPAQSDSLDAINGYILEQIIPAEDQATDNPGYPELLEELMETPVDLNKADIMDLQKIPFIDAASADLIITHRNKYGQFFSGYELYSVEGLPSLMIKQILPFISIGGKHDRSESAVDAPGTFKLSTRSRLTSDLQERKAFIENKYRGNSIKIYNNFRLSFLNNFEVAALSEKDPGESSLTDFTSFYLKGENIYWFNKIIAGDFKVELGQGLVYWSPYSLPKGSDAIISVKKKGRGIIPFRSVDENNFFRGAAAEITFSSLTFLGLYSYNKFDANIDESSGIINSMPAGGYNRTDNEISRMDASGRQTIGGAVSYKEKDLFSITLIHSSTKYKHALSFKNNTLFNASSISYDYYPGNLNLSGETAYDWNSAASVNQILIPAGKLKFITSVKIYPNNFFSPNSNAFGEKNGTSGEKGFYTGIKYKSYYGEINLYYDQYKLGSTTDLTFPAEGSGWFIGYIYDLKKYLIGASYRNSNKDEILQGNLLSEKIRQQYKLELIYTPSKNINLKTRIVYNHVYSERSSIYEGYLFFQDMNYRIEKRLSFYTRIILFETDNFDAAVYEFENDVEGIFRSYALYGSGMRWYAVIKYRVINSVLISAKYSETYKPGSSTLGSGNSIIYGNLDNSLTLQLDLTF